MYVAELNCFILGREGSRSGRDQCERRSAGEQSDPLHVRPLLLAIWPHSSLIKAASMRSRDTIGLAFDALKTLSQAKILPASVTSSCLKSQGLNELLLKA